MQGRVSQASEDVNGLGKQPGEGGPRGPRYVQLRGLQMKTVVAHCNPAISCWSNVETSRGLVWQVEVEVNQNMHTSQEWL